MVPLTTELHYKSVQPTDKIGNQVLVECSTPSDLGDTCGLTWLLFFFFRHSNFSPNIDNIYIISGLSWKKKNSREENNRDCSWRRGRTKQIQNKERLSEHNETSIKFLKEAISCIPLANEDGADFEKNAFLFNPP